jgi:hypothetical protein
VLAIREIQSRTSITTENRELLDSNGRPDISKAAPNNKPPARKWPSSALCEVVLAVESVNNQT